MTTELRHEGSGEASAARDECVCVLCSTSTEEASGVGVQRTRSCVAIILGKVRAMEGCEERKVCSDPGFHGIPGGRVGWLT